MGMKTELHLAGNEYTNTATWFFLAYLIAEAPNSMSVYLNKHKYRANI